MKAVLKMKAVWIALAAALVVVLLVVANMTPPVALAQATSTPTNTPTSTNTPTPTNTPTTTPFPIARNASVGGTWLCRASSVDCVQGRAGAKMHFYASNGVNTFTLDGEAGAVRLSAPTAIATTTPALIVNSQGVSRLLELQKNLTPVANVDGSGIATFAGGLTVSAGSVSLPTGSIGIGAIANISRTVSIPLLSFAECTTNAGALLSFTDGTDAHPHLANSSTDGLGYTLSFDATGGSVDTDYVCTQIPVPQDYVDGGVVVVRATKGAETGANSELITCQISVNGAALTAAGTIATSGTASAAYSCPPTLTDVAAGAALGITLRITSGGTADDAVNFQAVEFRYTATE